MAIRARIKKKLQSILGLQQSSDAKVEQNAPSSTMPSLEKPILNANHSEEAVQTATVNATLEASQENEPQESVLSEEEQKIQKHLHRTRLGLLQFLQKKGGVLGLADLHDHSEKRYFIGHKKFSDLLEAMVAEGVIAYDWSTQQATLTEKGMNLLK